VSTRTSQRRSARRFRVVVHVDESSPDRQHLALGNAVHLLDELGEQEVACEIVFNGPAITAAKAESALASQLAGLAARGVGLIACANSMATAAIPREDLAPGFTVVASGIAHLVRRQHKGWAYIRP
jgi:intracellular sulfur oxidation DsrE/DsrF family protein